MAESLFWHQDQGARTALYLESGESCTYQTLIARADAFAEALGERRSLVLLCAGNDLGSLVAYLGCLRHGHPVLLVDGRSPPDRIRYWAECYRPDYVARSLGAEYQLQPYDRRAKVLHPELALLLTTSGSTGAARCVRLSYHNLQANAQSIAEYLRLDDSERAISVLPMSYSYGLSVINSHWLVGGALVLTQRSLMERPFWDLLQERQATSLAGVPYTYQMLERLRFRDRELPSLRYLTQAGGHLAPELVSLYGEYAQARGKRFYVMYGQTEATARMSYLPPEACLQRPDSVGIPIPQGEFTLLDEQGEELSGPGLTGELWYRGPNVMLGYAQGLDDLAAGPELDALATGDLACRDEAGFFYLLGRKARFIKLQGVRIGLDSLERALEERGLAAVCTGDDAQLLVVTEQQEAVNAVTEVVLQTLRIHPSMLRVVFLASIPHTPRGKPDYPAIREACREPLA